MNTKQEKKVVHYAGIARKVNFGNGDIRAVLIPVNHTNSVEGQEAVNGSSNTTSKVLHWDKETGVIETTYSIYVPVLETNNA